MLDLLKRIEAGYADRNAAAHGVWIGTADPNIARRRSIRAKGTSLKCADDPFSLHQIEAVCDRLDKLRVDFAGVLVELNLRGPMGESN